MNAMFVIYAYDSETTRMVPGEGRKGEAEKPPAPSSTNANEDECAKDWTRYIIIGEAR